MHCFQLIGLDSKSKKVGISTTAPPYLAARLHSVPTILHIRNSKSMQSCSEGSRGLSVPWRVTGIFTDTTISPGSWRRQRSTHYTIRAGRNLPDKEFRYLRTVIVTAAVYWGFSQKLCPQQVGDEHPSLTFQHRAGIRLYTSSFDFAGPYVFVKQLVEPFYWIPTLLSGTLYPEVTASICLVPSPRLTRAP